MRQDCGNLGLCEYMKKSILEQCTQIAVRHLPKHAQSNNYRHYSFIIQGNKIVDWGTNRVAEPLYGYPAYGKLHSECDAYFKAKGLLDQKAGFEVVNIRLSSIGGLKISKPCSCCQGFLKRFGCKTVWFSTEMGFARINI